MCCLQKLLTEKQQKKYKINQRSFVLTESAFYVILTLTLM